MTEFVAAKTLAIFAALFFMSFLSAIMTTKAIVCGVAFIFFNIMAVKAGGKEIYRKGLLYYLSSKARSTLLRTTFLEWLKSDSLSKTIAPYAPLLIGMDDAEFRLYLANAPAHVRDRLLRPGLVHLLPPGLQHLILGDTKFLTLQRHNLEAEYLAEIEKVVPAGVISTSIAKTFTLENDVSKDDFSSDSISSEGVTSASTPPLEKSAWIAQVIQAIIRRRLLTKASKKLTFFDGESGFVLSTVGTLTTMASAALLVSNLMNRRGPTVLHRPGASRYWNPRTRALATKFSISLTVLFWLLKLLHARAKIAMSSADRLFGLDFPLTPLSSTLDLTNSSTKRRRTPTTPSTATKTGRPRGNMDFLRSPAPAFIHSVSQLRNSQSEADLADSVDAELLEELISRSKNNGLASAGTDDVFSPQRLNFEDRSSSLDSQGKGEDRDMNETSVDDDFITGLGVPFGVRDR